MQLMMLQHLQLVPWTQEKEDQEPDAPCVRLDIAAVNKVVFEDLRLSWDELDFIGIKKVRILLLPLACASESKLHCDEKADSGQRPCHIQHSMACHQSY